MTLKEQLLQEPETAPDKRLALGCLRVMEAVRWEH